MTMAQTVRDVMTANPRTLKASDTIARAAQMMRDEDIGTIIVTQGEQIRGVITDRDIVVRAIADGADPNTTQLGDVCTGDVETVTPGTSIDDAVEIMRMKAIRRLPVVDGGRPIGVVSIGDLAIESHGEIALADISAAPPNK
jgi:CBS domain-containing protein